MESKMSLQTSLALMAVFLSSCISPLLEHVEADESVPPAPVEKARDCELDFSKAGFCASWSWDQRPGDDHGDEVTGSAVLRFWKKGEGSPFGPYMDPEGTVAVKLWMPAMGHGSSPVTVRPQSDAAGSRIPGVFTASRIFFSMPGEWEIRVQLKNGTQIVDQASRKESI